MCEYFVFANFSHVIKDTRQRSERVLNSQKYTRMLYAKANYYSTFLA